ncbi:MAG: tetratricopeptide repeat protein [Myxococcales bacterium]|nr:tetratricopeptide repeat protein [Myxococcales bacterium]
MSTTARAPVNEEEFLGALYKGGELLAAGKIVEARSFLEKAHQLAPKNEKAQNLLGLTYFKLGLFDQASDIYEKLVRENPADPTLRVNLGLVYLKTNNLPRCIKEFETATDLEPDHKKAHNYLGLALAQAGDYAKAREHFVLAGSEQMAEKMGRALTARIESAPSNHGLVVPPAPAAVAQAVTSQPAQLITPRPSGPPAPLPPASPPEEEIEVMSESEVMDADVVSGEQVIPIEQLMVTRPAPVPKPLDDSGPLEGAPIEDAPVDAAVDAAPIEEAPVEAVPLEISEDRPVEFTEERPLEPMPAEIDIAPPAPSGPRLDRDWGAQFGMEPEASAPAEVEPTADELPMIDVESEVSTQKIWVAPLVNSWDSASGMTPPPPSAPGERSVNVDPSAFVGSPSPVPQMETALDPAAEDPLWNAAKSASGDTAEPAPVTETSTDWNTPPDPNQEMNFSDVAPQEAAAPDAPSWSEPSTEASWEQPAPEQPPYDAAGAESQSVEQQGAVQQPAAEQQAWADEQSSVQVEQQAWDAPPAEQQTWDAQTAEQQSTAPVDQQTWDAPPAEQHTWDAPVEQQTWDTAEQQPADGSDAQQASDGRRDQQTWEQQPADAQPTAPDDLARPTAPGWSDAPPPVEPSWVAQPLSEFTPDTPPTPVQPPPSAPGRGYTPMEARTLVELGASTSDIEQPQAGPFHVGPHGLAVTVNGEMLTRMTNLVAIVGSVTAHPENRRARGRAVEQPFGEGPAQMQRLTGHGVVHLEMGGARFHALDLNDDSAYLREEHVFGFEETIGFEHGHLSEDGIKVGLDLVHLSGDGRVLLQLGGAMKSLAIPPGSPMMVPLQRLVGWFGRVSPRLTGFAGQGAVELTGDGFALLVTPG